MADGRERPSAMESRTLNVALLAAAVHVNKGKNSPFAGVAGFDRDYVLVVFGTYLQFRDRTGVIAFAFEFFGGLLFLVVDICVGAAAVLAGVAFKDLAVFLQLLAIEIDDLIGSIVGAVFRDHQLHAEGLGQDANIQAVAVWFVGPWVSTGVERQARAVGVGVFAHVQITGGAVDVEIRILLAVVRLLPLCVQRGQT